MITAIDESGDTGFGVHSSSRFILCGVTTPVPGALRSAIRAARVKVRRGRDYEFKYFDTHRHPHERKAFFDAALAHKFRFAVVAIEKVRGAYEPARSPACHWLTTTTLAALLRPEYLRRHAADPTGYLAENVYVDDNRDPAYLETLTNSFIRLGTLADQPVGLVDQPVFRDSKRDELIQLADMICGAFADSLDGRHEWFCRVKSRSLRKPPLMECVWRHSEVVWEIPECADRFDALR